MNFLFPESGESFATFPFTRSPSIIEPWRLTDDRRKRKNEKKADSFQRNWGGGGRGEGKKENLLKSKYASKVFCSRMERAIMYVNGTRSEKGARARPIGVRYRYRGVSADNK